MCASLGGSAFHKIGLGSRPSLVHPSALQGPDGRWQQGPEASGGLQSNAEHGWNKQSPPNPARQPGLGGFQPMQEPAAKEHPPAAHNEPEGQLAVWVFGQSVPEAMVENRRESGAISDNP